MDFLSYFLKYPCQQPHDELLNLLLPLEYTCYLAIAPRMRGKVIGLLKSEKVAKIS